jgi:[protein-PII] uridylyltransferase
VQLQLEAQRREDRLVFDLQTRVAERLGHVATKARRASEALMHRYYWAAKAVTQLSRILQQNLEDRLLGHADVPAIPINERFVERGGLLDLVHDHVYVQDQRAILETFLLYQTVPTVQGLSTRVMRALYNARSQMDARFRRDPVNRARFLEILRAPSGQTHVLRLMNDTSVLGRYLWVFRRIVGRMQHDLFHAYTVDQHILMVLRNVRRFFVAEHAHEYAYCSELALAFERPEVLYIAALFHDVAKGRGGDHSALGAEEVRRFCREHRVPPQDAALVEFLVREHLTMSQVAQKQDLSDPDVIARFVAKAGDTRHLTALYLLTVADIRGTSPKVWNAWKGKLLEDLYRISLRALGGAPVASAAEVEARKSEALRLLNLQSALPGGHEQLWRTLEVSYFLRHDAADIAWHSRSLSRLVGSTEPVVRARTSSVGEGLQVLVYSADQPDLFARLCAYFDKAGFSILDARIHTTRSVEGKAFALDTFQVVAPDLELPYRDLIALVESQLLASLQRAEPLGEPRQARLSRRVRHFPVRPRVSLRPDERAQRWLLEVSAADRPGLLYRIARILARHGVDLQLAKVSTLGERVEDHFVVSGAALAYTATVSQIEQDILEALSL